MAYIALKQTAMNFSQSKTVADAINDQFYVDDFLSSFKTENEALGTSLEVKVVLAKGGFDLAAFNSKAL